MINQFQTSDMYLAAYLLAKGFKVEKADRSLPHEVTFIFTQSIDELRSYAEDYEFKNATIETRKYVSAIKQIKSIIQNRA